MWLLYRCVFFTVLRKLARFQLTWGAGAALHMISLAPPDYSLIVTTHGSPATSSRTIIRSGLQFYEAALLIADGAHSRGVCPPAGTRSDQGPPGAAGRVSQGHQREQQQQQPQTAHTAGGGHGRSHHSRSTHALQIPAVRSSFSMHTCSKVPAVTSSSKCTYHPNMFFVRSSSKVHKCSPDTVISTEVHSTDLSQGAMQT